MITLKSTNQKLQTMTFELVKVNMCYLRAPLSWLTEQKNLKFLRSFQNAQRDTTNFAVNEHVRTYLCELCLLTSNDCRNDEHSEVTEGKTCEGVCIIWEKSINIMRSVFTFRTRPLTRFKQSLLFSSSLKKTKGGYATAGCVNNCFLVVVVVVVAVAFLSFLNFLTRRCKRYL